MSLNAYERESVVNTSDGDPNVTIWTAQAKFINRLKKHPKVTLVREGLEDGTAWAEFTIPANQWSPLSGIKQNRAPLSEEQKQALRDRLAASRGAQ